MKVWMIDAVNMTPYYNASLCRALLAEGCQVTMMTSPFLYDTWPIYRGTTVEFRFSRFLAHCDLRFGCFLSQTNRRIGLCLLDFQLLLDLRPFQILAFFELLALHLQVVIQVGHLLIALGIGSSPV